MTSEAEIVIFKDRFQMIVDMLTEANPSLLADIAAQAVVHTGVQFQASTSCRLNGNAVVIFVGIGNLTAQQEEMTPPDEDRMVSLWVAKNE